MPHSAQTEHRRHADRRQRAGRREDDQGQRRSTEEGPGPFAPNSHQLIDTIANARPPETTARLSALHRFTKRGGKSAIIAGTITISVLCSLTIMLLIGLALEMPREQLMFDLKIAAFVPAVVAPILAHYFYDLTLHLMAMENSLQAQAYRDALTGAPNRGWISGCYDDAVSTSVDKNTTFGVLLIDIDHFKQVNDTYGHAAGDTVLKEVVVRLGQSIRPTDRFGRHGGEEFLLLTSDQSPEMLTDFAEDIRRSFADTPFRVESQTLDVTVSMGVAMFDANAEKAKSGATINRADAALYRAKTSGRNRVVLDGRVDKDVLDSAQAEPAPVDYIAV